MFRRPRRAPPQSTTAVGPKRMAVVPLEDECLWYIIVNIHHFSPEILSLLPQAIRYRLLVNLPVVDVCQLESTSVMEGIDTEKLWESLCSDRLRLKLAGLPSLPHGMEGFSWKEKYFNSVLKGLFYEPIVAGCGTGRLRLAVSKYREFIDMLFSVPLPLGLHPACGLSLTESNYHHPSLVPHALQLDADMLNLFGVCHFRPRYLRINTATRSNLDLQTLQEESAQFGHFMSNVQFLELVGYTKYLWRVQGSDKRKELCGQFIQVLKGFLGSVTANRQNVLHGLNLDLSLANASVDSHTLTEDIVPALTLDLKKQLNCLQCVTLKVPSGIDLMTFDVQVESFFDALFSLPQLSTLELGVGLNLYHVKLLVQSWRCYRRGKKLSKLWLRLASDCSDKDKDTCLSILKEVCSHVEVVLVMKESKRL